MAQQLPVIPIAKPFVGAAEANAARRPILSGWLTQGPEVAAFEREFAERVGAPYACAVSSCTAALHLALLAVEVGPGDEVITASHSFIATANVVRFCGATPVFVDIDPLTFNVDPSRVERAVSARTRAIMCVHQLGMPCDMPALLAIGRRHGIPVIEDAACATGSELHIGGRWERIGKPHGDIACFSFHPRKVVTTGDGGMITTANADVDARFRLWRQHGMSVPDAVRHGSPTVIFESYPLLGFNYRLTDVQAAVGREQLGRLPEILSRRRALAARYRQLLASVSGVTPPFEPDWARSNWQSYCVRLGSGIAQRDVMQGLLDLGVSTRRGVMCAHTEPAYLNEPWACEAGPASCNRAECQHLRESEAAQASCVLLPLFAQMTEEEQNRVVASLSEVLATMRQIAS